MIVEHEGFKYKVYWQHVNNNGLKHNRSGQPIKSISQCIIEVIPIDDNLSSHLLSKVFTFKLHQQFDRKLGMKESFKLTVNVIENKFLRSLLWSAFLSRNAPKVYSYEGREYQYIREVMIKTADGGWVNGIHYRALYKTDGNRDFVRTTTDFIEKFRLNIHATPIAQKS